MRIIVQKYHAPNFSRRTQRIKGGNWGSRVGPRLRVRTWDPPARTASVPAHAASSPIYCSRDVNIQDGHNFDTELSRRRNKSGALFRYPVGGGIVAGGIYTTIAASMMIRE